MAPGHRYARVRAVRWEAYAVRDDGRLLGFVARLPEGLWHRYTAAGALPGRFAERDAAAAALGAPAHSGQEPAPMAAQPPAVSRARTRT
jgi:hypothetical protein